jgi:hypothetical protein
MVERVLMSKGGIGRNVERTTTYRCSISRRVAIPRWASAEAVRDRAAMAAGRTVRVNMFGEGGEEERCERWEEVRGERDKSGEERSLQAWLGG